MSITLDIVEDLEEVRNGLRDYLPLDPDFKVLASFKTAEEAVPEIPKLKPDIVIMDINLPGMSGIDCIWQIKEQCSLTRFMMFTVYENDEKVFEAFKSRGIGLSAEKYGLGSVKNSAEGTA